MLMWIMCCVVFVCSCHKVQRKCGKVTQIKARSIMSPEATIIVKNVLIRVTDRVT